MQLLTEHDGVRLSFATSESAPEVDGIATMSLTEAASRFGDADLVFSCLPHGASGPQVERVRTSGARVVDLSADLRMADHTVYGLTEFVRAKLPQADVVANPGCYPTAALVALVPFARAGLVDASRPIIVDAASGVTGAGRSPKPELLFGEVAEDFRAYGIGNRHRHLPEIQAGVHPFLGDADIVFTPHLLPVRRGILTTIHLPLRQALSREAAEAVYFETYCDEPCVRVMRGQTPGLRDVVYRNRVAVGVVPVEQVARPMVTIVAAIDNLLKGAAGQAVQNMNVMLGLPETQGLTC